MAMEPADIAKYKRLYLQTALAYARDMQQNLSILQQNHDNKDALQVVYLAAHSLKSQSLMMGYETIGMLSATLENICKAKEANTVDIGDNILALISSGVGKLQACLSEIEKTGKELDLSKEAKQLQRAFPGISEWQ